MCGIVGAFGGETREEGFNPLISSTLAHRGPDDEGFESGPGWWLGFRRLSIIDLSVAGHQPMSTDEGRYWLAFNGEIYNYRELRGPLESAGVRFRGQSDTEVLLHLLAREGPAALQRLNGMFAFAFVDTRKRNFLLARDRLGVKPLYWHAAPGEFRFASELKALLAWPEAPRKLNRSAVAEYLSLGYLTGGTSIFEGYGRLAPGHYAEGSLDAPILQPKPYWTPPIRPGASLGRSVGAPLEELEALVRDAVRIRLRSDVPVAILLSGGIDSGLVAAFAAEGNGTPPLGLTVDTIENGIDEAALARRTAEQIGLELRVLEQRPIGLTDIDALAETFDEPFGDVSALPTMLVCSAASEHATVLLSGDGGDEAFGGYRRYIEAARYGWTAKLPAPLRSAIWEAGQLLPTHSRLRYRLGKLTLPDDGLAAVFDGLGLMRDAAFHAILPADLRADIPDVAVPIWALWEDGRGLDRLSRQRALDYRSYLPDDVLVKVDRASMAHSTELRSPFLDYRLVEWAARQPPQSLVQGGVGKMPLRRLAKGRLPAEVTDAPKRGFGIPIGAWLREKAGQDIVRERLLAAGNDDLWDCAGVSLMLQKHLEGRRDFGEYLWRLLMLEAWSRRYLRVSRIQPRQPSVATLA